MRALIVAADGRILRTVRGNPAMFHLQAGPGEAVFALTDGDEGQAIDDAAVTVSEAGDLIAAEGEPPAIQLQYVPG